MKSITFITGEFKQEKTSAWLVTFVKYVQKLDFVSLLEKVKVKMKKGVPWCQARQIDSYLTIHQQ